MAKHTPPANRFRDLCVKGSGKFLERIESNNSILERAYKNDLFESISIIASRADNDPKVRGQMPRQGLCQMRHPLNVG